MQQSAPEHFLLFLFFLDNMPSETKTKSQVKSVKLL